MPDTQFPCPHCGHELSRDMSASGSVIRCPACGTQARIPSTAADQTDVGQAAPPPVAGTPSTAGSVMPGERPTWSVLAIVSFVTGVLCIPFASVICGHLALREFRRTPNLQGKWMAIVGLVLGYLTILAMVLAIVIGIMSVALRMQTQQSSSRVVTETAGVAASSSHSAQQGRSGNAPEPPASSEILDNEISGSIEGVTLAIQRAKVSNGNLEFRSGTSGFSSDQWIMVFLFAGNQPLEGRSWVVPTLKRGNQPHVHLHWKDAEGKQRSKALSSNYSLRLEFGDPSDGILSGRVYFACDQPVNAEFSGRFEAEID